MSTLAQTICVTTSASAIAYHCPFNNSYALMTTSGKSASRIQTHPRLPARLTLHSRAPSFSRRFRMSHNVRRKSGHMPTSGFRAFSSAPPVHPRIRLTCTFATRPSFSARKMQLTSSNRFSTGHGPSLGCRKLSSCSSAPASLSLASEYHSSQTLNKLTHPHPEDGPHFLTAPRHLPEPPPAQRPFSPPP
jgi:hypothetical protein